MYPSGTGDSVAVQVVSAVLAYPFTVKLAGAASDEGNEVWVGLPGDVHDKLTDTLVPLLSEKSFTTVNFAELSVFVIVQVPSVSVARQVPGPAPPSLPVYPTGTARSRCTSSQPLSRIPSP